MKIGFKGKNVKVLGWISIFLGSNGLTGALVAKIFYNKLDSAVNNAIESAGEWLVNNLGGVLGKALSNTVGNTIESFIGVSEQVDAGGRANVECLFYIAIALLIFGTVLLITGYLKSSPKSDSD